MARQERPVEPTVVEPDPTVYVIEPSDWTGASSVSEPTRITRPRPPRERERQGIDSTRISDNTVPIRTVPTGFTVRPVK